jgi:hypothetical protein
VTDASADVDLGRVAAAIRTATAAQLGDEAELDGEPEVLVAGFGPNAFGCELVGDHPGGWGGPLVVRLAHAASGREISPAALEHEASWNRFCAADGISAPEILAVDADALVMTRPYAQSVIEAMGERPTDIPQLLGLLGTTHAALHRRPVDGAPVAIDHRSPLEALEAEIDAVAAQADLGKERAWLAEQYAGFGHLAICHGDFQPAHLRLDPDDHDAHAVANWAGAGLADPEYDVARTVLTLWAAPYLAPTRAQRMFVKAARDMVIDAYRNAYKAELPLDGERLRYWGAFHTCWWSALAAHDGAGRDPWDPLGLVHNLKVFRDDLRRRFWELARLEEQ